MKFNIYIYENDEEFKVGKDFEGIETANEHEKGYAVGYSMLTIAMMTNSSESGLLAAPFGLFIDNIMENCLDDRSEKFENALASVEKVTEKLPMVSYEVLDDGGDSMSFRASYANHENASEMVLRALFCVPFMVNALCIDDLGMGLLLLPAHLALDILRNEALSYPIEKVKEVLFEE